MAPEIIGYWLVNREITVYFLSFRPQNNVRISLGLSAFSPFSVLFVEK